MIKQMKHPFPSLLCFLVFKALLIAALIVSGVIGLGPDEAQYWTWSRELDLGYYSKPPGIAWQIWAGTQLFGNTELGVRFFSLVFSFLSSLAIYFLARSCRLKEWTAFWAAICFAFSPLGILGSLLATTDGGLVLFWTLACIEIAAALSEGRALNYYLFGFLIACGALFKWPIYLLWVFVVLAAVVYPHLRTRALFVGMAVSLFGLLPSIVWNVQHDFATFQHVFSTVKGGHASGTGGNFWDFIGAQAALVSPILFILLVMGFAVMLRRLTYMWPSVLFCGLTSTVLLTAYALLSLNQKIQGNWVVFAYPTGMVLLAWYALEHAAWGKKWLFRGVALSIVLTCAGLLLPLMGILPYRMNPLRHNLGWEAMEKEIAVTGYDPDLHFLFGDKYQISSLLSFYSPQKKRAYFLNLQGARKNQFSYWPGMWEEQTEKDGYYVVVENAPYLDRLHLEGPEPYLKLLTPYCEKVEYQGFKPLITQSGEVVKGVFIYKCLGYNGRFPIDGDLY
jgi:4-amino-4-deoxy-L-arabinose transferase-like glycosyltransferase